MASRTKQKEEARARRLAEERARLERERQQRRIRMVGGTVLGAIAVVAVAIAVSTGNSSKAPALNSAAASQAAATVAGQLGGISQSGNRLGSPTAKVTVTEYGDLQCPVCRDFALNTENQLIANDVRTGKVQLVYRSLETATQSDPNAATVFPLQQSAALAAGQQGHGWDYILLFYQLQRQEGSGYVTNTFLDGIAKLIPGLNFSKWSSAVNSENLTAQVTADEQSAQSKGFSNTPTILVQGPKGQAQPIVGAVDYKTLEQSIKLVS